MRLFHTTPWYNTVMIEKNGILPCRSLGELDYIWLHTWALRTWARRHIADNHGCDPRSMVRYALDVPRSWVAHRRRGIWVCFRGFEPSRLKSKTHYVETSHLTALPLLDINWNVDHLILH